MPNRAIALPNPGRLPSNDPIRSDPAFQDPALPSVLLLRVTPDRVLAFHGIYPVVGPGGRSREESGELQRRFFTRQRVARRAAAATDARPRPEHCAHEAGAA